MKIYQTSSEKSSTQNREKNNNREKRNNRITIRSSIGNGRP